MFMVLMIKLHHYLAVKIYCCMLYIVPGHYPEIFGKMKFFKKSEKKNITRSSLNELATQNPNSAGFHETLSGSKAPKAPTVIRYYKLKMDNS